MSKFHTIMGTGLGLVFMVVGGGLIPIGYQELKNAQESLNWSTTNGLITSSAVKESQVEDSISYEADVRYQYTVAEKPYSSDRVTFGQYGSSDSEHAQSIVHRYQKGQKVSVHFNSQQPSQSVLEPGATCSSYTMLGASTLFFTTGAIFAGTCGIILPKRQRKRTENIKQAASNLALTFSEEDKTLQYEDFYKLPLFQRGYSREMRNILRKRGANWEAILCDYEFQEGSGEDSNQYQQTVAVFQVPYRKLPEFNLRPKNLSDKIKEFFRHKDINFTSNLEFSQSYRLQGQPESGIREVFNFPVLQFFSQHPGWWVEGWGEWLIIYQLNKQIQPEKISVFIEQTTQISHLFS
ncbi:DUF3592 domain-containing protein [Calothrix sp. NIES-2098]|uniref:DUF3592 domain-containing protein n=1 Tax=Calothrix sp. NIES-2098 TaxID=1954171 RepID=UPI000B5EABC9|nr:hypothetical protein NIES2098_00860 [Calothrix sp. NIES-2098]